jgi:STE24 endopeptidase
MVVYFWLASLPVLLAGFFLKPLVVDPLFYTFKPLAGAAPALVSEIQKVTGRGGIDIPTDRMFVMNASAKITELDAYVTGFRGLQTGCSLGNHDRHSHDSRDTVRLRGHYVLLHLPKGIACAEAILFLLFYVGYRLALWMLARWKTAWGIRDLAAGPLSRRSSSSTAYWAFSSPSTPSLATSSTKPTVMASK